MEKYDSNTLSAAISDLGEMLMTEGNVDVQDIDGMARASTDAETMIRDELVRNGMSMVDAARAVDEAASRTSRTTNVSKALMEAARQNRFQPVNASNDDRTDDGHSENDKIKEPATEEGSGTETGADTNQNDVERGKERSDTEKNAEKKKAAGNRENDTTGTVVRAPSGPVSTMNERAQILGELISYTVEMKPVHEVFRGIDKDQEIFDFLVPVFNWERQHPLIPAIDMAYNMEVESLLTCLYAISERKSTALVGPHGCGKTKLVEQIGARLNMPVVVIPMDGQMSRAHLFGQEKLRATENGTESYYQYGVLPSAMLEPGIIMFDEFDRADDSVQYACHSVYEQTYLTLLEHDGRKIPLHEHNRVFGTANTKGRGSDDGMYMGGTEMSEATRDRWSAWIDMDYQGVEDDIMVLKAKVKALPANQRKIIARLAGQIREAFKNAQLSQTCSMRQQLEAAQYAVFLISTTKTKDEDEKMKCLRLAVERIIMGRANDSDRGAIETMFKTIAPKAYEGDPIVR